MIVFYDTPPPTMNGKPHLGHVYAYTLCKIIGDLNEYDTQFGADTVGAFSCGTTPEEMCASREAWEKMLGQKFSYTTAAHPAINKFKQELLFRGELTKRITPPFAHDHCSYGRERMAKELSKAIRPWNLHIKRDNGLYPPWLNSCLTWTIGRHYDKIVRFQGEDIIGTWLYWSLVSFAELGKKEQRFEVFVHETVKKKDEEEKLSKSKGASYWEGDNLINDHRYRYLALTSPKGGIDPTMIDEAFKKADAVKEKFKNLSILLKKLTLPEPEFNILEVPCLEVFKLYKLSEDKLYELSSVLWEKRIKQREDLVVHGDLMIQVMDSFKYLPILKRLLNLEVDN